jgi:hypothetical protein
MGVDIDGIKLVEKISPHLHRPATVLILIVVVASGVIFSFVGFDITQLLLKHLLSIEVICIIVWIFWYYSTRLPRAPANCIGIAIAISAETVEQQKRLNADLVATLKKTLSQGNNQYRFKVIEIPRERAALIQSQEDARELRKLVNCKFMLWGTAKLRDINDDSTHVINLHIQVGHNPIPEVVSKQFSKDISEIYPSRLHLAQKNDLIVLEFTAEWLDLVIRYVVGVSLAFSGFVDAAEKMFETLFNDAKLNDAKGEPIRKLKLLNRKRLADIYDWRASRSYEAWRSTRSVQDIDMMGRYLSKLRGVVQNSYSIQILSSIYLFISKRDIYHAIAELKHCNEIDATWRYNLAFLYAYSGNMVKARRVYRSAFERSCRRSDVPIQTEEFMLWVLSHEPDKGQLHFCLGLVNWHGKNDIEQAVKDFQNFRDAGLESQFPQEYSIVETYISTLKGELAARNKKLFSKD